MNGVELAAVLGAATLAGVFTLINTVLLSKLRGDHRNLEEGILSRIETKIDNHLEWHAERVGRRKER